MQYTTLLLTAIYKNCHFTANCKCLTVSIKKPLCNITSLRFLNIAVFTPHSLWIDCSKSLTFHHPDFILIEYLDILCKCYQALQAQGLLPHTPIVTSNFILTMIDSLKTPIIFPGDSYYPPNMWAGRVFSITFFIYFNNYLFVFHVFIFPNNYYK